MFDSHSEITKSKQGRVTAAKMLMRLFELWKLTPNEELLLLDLNESDRESLNHYRAGKRAIENNIDTLNRVSMLFNIHAMLRVIFPENPMHVYGWMSAQNKALNNQTPLDIVQKHHFIGLHMLVNHLYRLCDS